MLQLLCDSNEYSELDKAGQDILCILRNDFSFFPIKNLATDRPIIIKEGKVILFSFQGTKINRTLQFLLSKSGIGSAYEEYYSSKFEISIPENKIEDLAMKLIATLHEVDAHLENTVKATPTILDFSKWGLHLPISFQCKLLKEKYFDFQATKIFIENINFVVSKIYKDE